MLSTQNKTKPFQSIQSETAYLINKSKAMSGHKLKMSDAIKLQLIKNRRSSPCKNKKLQSKDKELSPLPLTQYADKYKGFQTVQDEEELYYIIAKERKKQSQSTITKIKLFNRGDDCESARDGRTHSNRSDIKAVRARTAITQRSSRSTISHHQTISNDFPNSNRNDSSLDNNNTNRVEFISQNLDKRMNEYMNLVLQKRHNCQIDIKVSELREEMDKCRQKELMDNQQRQAVIHYKRKNNNFYRQMKKYQKLKITPKNQNHDQSETLREKELVKSLMQQTQTISHQARPQTGWKQQSSKFYSAQLRKQQPLAKDFKDSIRLKSDSFTHRQEMFRTLQSFVRPSTSRR